MSGQNTNIDFRSWKKCVDRDHRISLHYPATWDIQPLQRPNEADTVTAFASPPGPFGQQAAVFISTARLPPGFSLEDWVNLDIAVYASKGDVLKSRQDGRHPSGMAATTCTIDGQNNNRLTRKEIIFLRVSLDAVATVCAIVDHGYRREFVDAIRGIFKSIQRAPYRIDSGAKGTASVKQGVLPPGAQQFQWVWSVYDQTAQVFTREIRAFAAETFSQEISPTTGFEFQTFLFFQLMILMSAARYATPEKVKSFFYRGLAGSPYFDIGHPRTAMEEAVAKRITLYIDVDMNQICSPLRNSVLAELIRLPGSEDSPATFDPHSILGNVHAPTDWHEAVGKAIWSISGSFSVGMASLFMKYGDVEAVAIDKIEQVWLEAARSARS